MRWQYTFARGTERDKGSSLFRADDFCLQKLIWNLDGTCTWKIVRLVPVAKL